ncbi:cation:proton antiporter [Fuchsiella alkaliacetigena]|uniref:cation:proton antiporter n=1 Tax=Fuchsiella alkaliacetigena TaxID=957042 RepID=UPI002009E30B|nr:cation:proton antiporter [Fuchsiella alkaliacetigena]MCK8825134.1 cation:proton antiporter [Fuchsiella alkaliacetigena]
MINLVPINTLNEVQQWLIANQSSDKAVYVIALLMAFGLLAVLFTKKIKMPIIVGYVFLGILLSISLIRRLPFLSGEQKDWYAFTLTNFSYVADLALGFIAFTIGTELSVKIFKNLGQKIFLIVVAQALGAFILVTITIVLVGQPIYVALILGAVATASAPGSTVMVLKEYQAEGLLTSLIMAVVGIGDAVTLIIFSLAEPIALIKHSGVGEVTFSSTLLPPLLEIIGSVVMGLIIGYLSQKMILSFHDKTKKILTVVATITGALALSLLLHLSPLITNMAVGFAYRNFSRRKLGIAASVEAMTTPLYAMFFIIAGAKIKLSTLTSPYFLFIAGVYIVSRVIGKIGGAYIGAKLVNAETKIKKYIGFGLLSQSGLSLALAFTVQQDFASTPEIALLIFNIILFTSVLSEVFGPLATKYAIIQAGEINN